MYVRFGFPSGHAPTLAHPDPGLLPNPLKKGYPWR